MDAPLIFLLTNEGTPKGGRGPTPHHLVDGWGRPKLHGGTSPHFFFRMRSPCNSMSAKSPHLFRRASRPEMACVGEPSTCAGRTRLHREGMKGFLTDGDPLNKRKATEWNTASKVLAKSKAKADRDKKAATDAGQDAADIASEKATRTNQASCHLIKDFLPKRMASVPFLAKIYS